jgi:hypothetical protein
MTRPLYYPYHDVYETNIVLPQDSLFIFSGYPPGLPVPSADHNGKFNSNYKWTNYLDQGTLRNDDWLSSSNAAISTSVLTYANGGNVTTTGAVVSTYASYLINNNRIEIDDAVLNGVGAATMGSPLVMPGAITPGRIWVYVNSAGVTRFEAVAAATPDAPIGSEITLVGLDVDATGVVTDGAVVPVTLPLPTQQLTVAVPIVITGSDTMLSVTGGGVGAPAVVIDGTADIGLSVQTNSASPAATFKQNGAGTAITAQGNVTITVDLLVSGDATVTGTTSCDGDVSLGTGAGNTVITVGFDNLDTMNVTAASVFNSASTFLALVDMVDLNAIGNVTLGTGVGVKTVNVGLSSTDQFLVAASSTFSADISFGANTITGTGGTLDTETVIATEVHYNNGGAGPTGDGESGYNGRKLTLGDGSVARRVHTPVEDYTISDTTVLAIEDITGASVTMDIGDDEWIRVRLNAAHLLAGADTFNVLIAASNGVDSVTVLNSGDDDAASYGFAFGASQKIMQSLVVRWKPTNDVVTPDNTTWTLQVRHGVSGGNTLTTSNVQLEAWYE